MDVSHSPMGLGKGIGSIGKDPYATNISTFIYTYRNIVSAIYTYIYICIIKCIKLQYTRTMFNILPHLHITKRDIRNAY